MPLQATSGAASYDAFGGGVPVVPNYIEDVFSTWLYTGNGTSQTITNGIDLAGKGGMVWIKSRSDSENNAAFDTSRGVNNYLLVNTDFAQLNYPTFGITAFNSNGFSVAGGAGYAVNTSASTYASWTFREQAKFFDIVTYTGTGVARTIAHNLGSVPGCMIIKKTNAVKDWAVYHRSTGNTQYLSLNTNAAAATSASYWNNTTPTSTVFTVGIDGDVNANGDTYVAYLFAHDAGGFGLTGTDNVISCGSFTGNGSATGPIVTLGYEPQWIMIKNASTNGTNWIMFDNMRGVATGGNDPALFPNLTNAEASAEFIEFNATGFQIKNISSSINGSGATLIYVAIRRGPMKVPTTGTSVYQGNTYTGNATANTTVAGNFGFPVDLMLLSNRSANATAWSSYAQMATDRLRGVSVLSATASAAAESADWTTYQSFSVPNNIGWGLYGAESGTGYMNNSGGTWVARGFRRAPSFFDEVCYTGTGSNRTVAHNLGVAPELMIFKVRSTTDGWQVYCSALDVSGGDYLLLNDSAAKQTNGSTRFTAAPTSTLINLATNGSVNGSGSTYVAYLFATCAGVSKVGSYTGTGTTLQINCGFTAGARFVLIKRTDSTGDWYVWDSARGIVAGNDPYLLLNSTAAEVTNTDYVDTYSAGFEISSTAPAAINASAGTFIFLAIS